MFSFTRLLQNATEFSHLPLAFLFFSLRKTILGYQAVVESRHSHWIRVSVNKTDGCHPVGLVLLLQMRLLSLFGLGCFSTERGQRSQEAVLMKQLNILLLILK